MLAISFRNCRLNNQNHFGHCHHLIKLLGLIFCSGGSNQTLQLPSFENYQAHGPKYLYIIIKIIILPLHHCSNILKRNMLVVIDLDRHTSALLDKVNKMKLQYQNVSPEDMRGKCQLQQDCMFQGNSLLVV